MVKLITKMKKSKDKNHSITDHSNTDHSTDTDHFMTTITSESSTNQVISNSFNSYISILMNLLSKLEDELVIYKNFVENEQNFKELIIFMQMAINLFWANKGNHTIESYPQLITEEEFFMNEALKMYLRERFQKCKIDDDLNTNSVDVLGSIVLSPHLSKNDVDISQLLCDETNDWIEIDEKTDWDALIQCHNNIHFN